jgi:predicted amidophosphoribosyltransferase
LPIGCKGICNRFENKRGGKYSVYRMGFKGCPACNIYIKVVGTRCPCCGYPLRSKKRSYQSVRNDDKLYSMVKENPFQI